MLPRVEYSVTVPVSVDAAFRAFQDQDRLLDRGIYSRIVWTEGTAWQAGSRLHYILEKPISASVSTVVSSISVPRSIVLLHHALGITAEQHITFGPDLKGGSRVRVAFEFLGTSPDFTEEQIRDMIAFLAKDALDTLVDACSPRSTGRASRE